MAAKLQCEICGGKLVGKPGGIFECENCGTEYSTAWAKEKIQEITGKVQVEGTVEVTGKVQVEGGTVQVDTSANKEALLQRGRMVLEDGDWEKAKGFFDQVLSMDAQCGEAYLGLAMAEAKMKDREAFEKAYTDADSILRYQTNNHIARARKYDPVLETWFSELDQKYRQARQVKILAIQRAKEETARRLEPIRQRYSTASKMISAGWDHTVGLKADGTVLAVGSNSSGKCNVSSWRDIIAVSTGRFHTVGLKADGTVLAVGFDKDGQCQVNHWRDIVAISAGDNHTVGLKADGTVVATKYLGEAKYYRGQCDVGDWRDIVAVSAGGNHTVGLKANGTVLAVGWDFLGRCQVSHWSDIVAISAGDDFTVGLKADGTVSAVGNNAFLQCRVSDWRDIVAVSAGMDNTVGLKADGTVVATNTRALSEGFLKEGSYVSAYYGQGDVRNWRDIVAISAGRAHSIGLKADGTVTATKAEKQSMSHFIGGYQGQCEVGGWKLFDSISTVEAERKAALERAEAKRRARIAALKAEREKLQDELPNLRGLFSGIRRRDIEARLAEIAAELKKLG